VAAPGELDHLAHLRLSLLAAFRFRSSGYEDVAALLANLDDGCISQRIRALTV
jgi:hypothetical protein